MDLARFANDFQNLMEQGLPRLTVSEAVTGDSNDYEIASPRQLLYDWVAKHGR